MKIDVTKLSDVELYKLIDEAQKEKRTRRDYNTANHSKSFKKDGISYIIEYTYDTDLLSTALKKRLTNIEIRIASEQAKAQTIIEQSPKTKIKCWRSRVAKEQ